MEDTIAGIAVYHLCMGCIGVSDAQKNTIQVLKMKKKKFLYCKV